MISLFSSCFVFGTCTAFMQLGALFINFFNHNKYIFTFTCFLFISDATGTLHTFIQTFFYNRTQTYFTFLRSISRLSIYLREIFHQRLLLCSLIIQLVLAVFNFRSAGAISVKSDGLFVHKSLNQNLCSYSTASGSLLQCER